MAYVYSEKFIKKLWGRERGIICPFHPTYINILSYTTHLLIHGQWTQKLGYGHICCNCKLHISSSGRVINISKKKKFTSQFKSTTSSIYLFFTSKQVCKNLILHIKSKTKSHFSFVFLKSKQTIHHKIYVFLKKIKLQG